MHYIPSHMTSMCGIGPNFNHCPLKWCHFSSMTSNITHDRFLLSKHALIVYGKGWQGYSSKFTFNDPKMRDICQFTILSPFADTQTQSWLTVHKLLHTSELEKWECQGTMFNMWPPASILPDQWQVPQRRGHKCVCVCELNWVYSQQVNFKQLCDGEVYSEQTPDFLLF